MNNGNRIDDIWWEDCEDEFHVEQKKRGNLRPSTTSMEQKVTMLKRRTPPVVRYSLLAWTKIKALVEEAKGEVGWLGTVEKTDYGYLITDIFIPRQQVTQVTTDIEPEAMAELVMQLLEQDKDPSTLRYWGHSHVDMPVRPSQTDEDQIDEYLESADVDFFIRGIYNKQGDSKVDVYDQTAGLAYECVPNEVEIPPNVKEYVAQRVEEVVEYESFRVPRYQQRYPLLGAKKPPKAKARPKAKAKVKARRK